MPRTVENLLELLRQGETVGEPDAGVDQLAHALQCAHELRGAAPDDRELQVAGLLHDVGHMLAPEDDAGHGRVGAEAVRPVLGDRVARLVELHVPAKRYLVSVDAGYALSPGSIRSLQNQGGPMGADEVTAFAALPECDAAVLLRRADEAAKVPGRQVPDLETWVPVLQEVAAVHDHSRRAPWAGPGTAGVLGRSTGAAAAPGPTGHERSGK